MSEGSAPRVPDEKEDTNQREPESKRTNEPLQLKLASETSRRLAALFVEHKRLSLRKMYGILQKAEVPPSFTKSALRGVLTRWLKRRILLIDGSAYILNPNSGAEILLSALEGKKAVRNEGALRRVLKADEKRERVIDVRFIPWREKIAVDSSWSEHTRITKIWLDPFIIQNIRSATGETPTGGNPAKWLTVRRNQFTLQISKLRAIQLWVNGPEWRLELSSWLEQVPNLLESHLDAIWNRIDERAKLLTTTTEAYVTDPVLASKAGAGIQVIYGDGTPDTLVRIVTSHGLGEIEVHGAIPDRDHVWGILAGNLAAAAIWEHKYEREIKKVRDEISQEFERKFQKLKEDLDKKVEEKIQEKREESESKQLQLKEGSDGKDQDYYA